MKKYSGFSPMTLVAASIVGVDLIQRLQFNEVNKRGHFELNFEGC